jgi:hypothetical protein
MKPKVLPLLERCVELGIERGYNRAYKHEESPSKEHIQTCIFASIMDEFDEWFEFEDSIIDNKR